MLHCACAIAAQINRHSARAEPAGTRTLLPIEWVRPGWRGWRTRAVAAVALRSSDQSLSLVPIVPRVPLEHRQWWATGERLRACASRFARERSYRKYMHPCSVACTCEPSQSRLRRASHLLPPSHFMHACSIACTREARLSHACRWRERTTVALCSEGGGRRQRRRPQRDGLTAIREADLHRQAAGWQHAPVLAVADEHLQRHSSSVAAVLRQSLWDTTRAAAAPAAVRPPACARSTRWRPPASTGHPLQAPPVLRCHPSRACCLQSARGAAHACVGHSERRGPTIFR